MIFRSPHPQLTIPNLALTDYVLREVDRHGAKAALIDGSTGRTINYDQLKPTVETLAALFRQHGIGKGEVFAIYAPNSPEYVLAFLALASIGAVTTMIAPLFRESEVLAQMQNSGARYLLTVPALMDRAKSVATALSVREIFVLAEGAIEPVPRGPAEQPQTNETGFGIDHKLKSAENIELATDLGCLPYSSGTTGFPKGVMLTHRNLVALLEQVGATEPFTPGDTLVCVVPMYHLYGLHVVANLALSKGATVVTLPRFDLNQFLTVLEQHRVTVAPLVPPLVLTLARAPEVDHHDLSSLKSIHCGAASLAPDLARACVNRLQCGIRFGYGLTEASPLSHMTTSTSIDGSGTVGYCLPNTECKIGDISTGAELGPNQQGEICIRGPQVMKGYLGDPEATAEMIDSEGWLHSGDIGYADENGRLFVVDRLKELIKYKGRQVAPAELEAVLFSHPAIADAGVVPSLDEAAGEVPKAYVVLKEAAGEISAEEIMTFVAERVAPHKKIRRLEFVSEIPKSPAGKILRRVLIERDRRGEPA